MRNEDLPFSAVMDALSGQERVSIPLLFRLSDMSEAEMAQFANHWSELSGERRRVITRHLADISEENFQVDFSPVFAICLQDSVPAVRMAALDGLWDSDKTSLIGPIIDLMQGDESVDVRASAAGTLGHYILMAEWGELPKKFAPPIVDALLAQIDAPDTDLAVRRTALESLGGACHPRVPDLIRQAYYSDEEPLQISAVFAMGKSADTRWSTIIEDELTSLSLAMRLEAVRAAGGIGLEETIPQLAQLIRDDEPEIRLAAVAALGQIGGQEAYRLLAALSEDPDAEDLFEAIDEALEELDWLGGEFDLSLVDWDTAGGDDEDWDDLEA